MQRFISVFILLHELDGAPLERSDLLDCSNTNHKFLRCIDGQQYGKSEACLFNNGYYDLLYSAQNYTVWNSNIADPNWIFARYCDEMPPLPPCEPVYDPTAVYLPLDTVVYNSSVYTRIGPPAAGGPTPNDDTENWRMDSLSCHLSDFLPVTPAPRTEEVAQSPKPPLADDISRIAFHKTSGLRRVRASHDTNTSISCSRYVICPNRLIAWREICVDDGSLWIVNNTSGALTPARDNPQDWRHLATCSSPPEPSPCYYPEWVRRRMYWPYDRVTFSGVQYQALKRNVNIAPGLSLDPPSKWPPGMQTWEVQHECITSLASASMPKYREEALPEIDCLYNETKLLRCLPKIYPALSTCLSGDMLWTSNVTQAWPNSSSNGFEWYPVFQCENGMPELPSCNTESKWDPTYEYKALDKVVYDTYIWEARYGAQPAVPPLADGGEWDILTPCAPTVDLLPPNPTTAATTSGPSYTGSVPAELEIVDCSEYLDWFPWRQFNYKEIVRYYSPAGNYAWEVIWKEGAIRDYPPRAEYGWKRIYACIAPVVGDCDNTQIWSPTEPYIPTERVKWNDVLWEATAFLEVSEAPSLDNTSWKSIQQCEPLDNIVPSVVPT